MTATQFVARQYRYANGVVYNPNRYIISHLDGDQARSVGGALKVGGKVIAYVGHPGLGTKVDAIVRGAEAFTWGSTMTEALAKIRPSCEREVEIQAVGWIEQ